MKNALMKFKNNLAATREDESGDIVQTVLIIAVFVVIVVIVGNILYDAIKKKADDVNTCINGVKASSAGTNGKC